MAADRAHPGGDDGRKARVRRANARLAKRRDVQCRYRYRCRCRGRGRCCRRVTWRVPFCRRLAAPFAAFTAIPWPEAERDCTRRAAATRRMARAEYFVSRCKAGRARRRKMVDPRHCNPLRAAALVRRPALPADRPLGKAAGTAPLPAGRGTTPPPTATVPFPGTTPSDRIQPELCRSIVVLPGLNRVTSDGTS